LRQGKAVRPFADSPPDRFLVQLQKKARKCRREKPLVIFQGKGIYTEEMAKLLAGD
jgi:tRNA1(Val) A37 N6-methylase TrmN6